MKNKKISRNKTRNRKPPRFLQSVLWSYDISKMDINKDKELIIQQVLNYGNWQALQWLFDNYKRCEIIKIINNPSRGRWFESVLGYWSLIFNLKINREKYRSAIFDINPHFR